MKIEDEYQEATAGKLRKLGWREFEHNLEKSLPGPIVCFEIAIRDGPGGGRRFFRAIVGRRFTTVYQRRSVMGGMIGESTLANGSKELAARLSQITPE